MKIARLLFAASLVFAGAVHPASAQQLRAELVASDLALPVAFVQDPSQPDVQLIVQQHGRIRVLHGGALGGDFLNLTNAISIGGERGLLGLVFAPDYATSGRLFVKFTNPAGDTVVARFLRDGGDPLRADPASRFDLVWPSGHAWVLQPFTNHNAGHMAFGPDGYLYIGMGDGGGGSDPFHNAQNPGTLLGKMLRIDVSVPDGHPTGYTVPPNNPFVGVEGVMPEIWAFGLRNPWRYSFDDWTRGGTGALLIADVGQGHWEEVNYEPSGAAGRNYGWRNREGAHFHVVSEPAYPIPLTDPIFEYDHTQGRSITGGYVYRGSALGGGYYGRYFFADIIRSRVWSLGLSVDGSGEAAATDVIEHTGVLGTGASQISSFGVDANGELYLVSYGPGRIFRLALEGGGPAPPPPPPPPPPSPDACTTEDPFGSMGGGTCCNGGWLPPGMTCVPSNPPDPGPGDPPPPPPDPGPGDPPPPPPPGPQVCSTADPFVSMGGGTCCSGGWLPPGMTCAGNQDPGDPPPPPPDGPGDPPPPPPDGDPGNPPPPPPDEGPGDPPPPPSPGSCTTPDPFVTLGGGTCYDGGWLPPGMAAPADPSLVSGTGTMDTMSSSWVIVSDGGGILHPLSVPESLQISGRRVRYVIRSRTDFASPLGAVVQIIEITPL